MVFVGRIKALLIISLDSLLNRQVSITFQEILAMTNFLEGDISLIRILLYIFT